VNDTIKRTIKKYARQTMHRGPDMSLYKEFELQDDYMLWVFHQLAVMDTHLHVSNQPMVYDRFVFMCNGEIYNYKQLQASLKYTVTTTSDCEALFMLLVHVLVNQKTHIEETLANILNYVDGEYAFILWDRGTNWIISGRDPTGIRPLFITYPDNHNLCISSERKGCLGNCEPLNPKYMYIHKLEYNGLHARSMIKRMGNTPIPFSDTLNSEHVLYDYMLQSVSDRMMGEASKGCFLSGGLDSSIIASLLVSLGDTTTTFFTIGIKDSIDVMYARQVANYLGIQDRHKVYTFTVEEGCNEVLNVINSIETYDITTIRASIPQYLLCKYIKRDYPHIKVMFSGEGSDELFQGYQYSYLAPSDHDLVNDRDRLLEELYLFDNLRVDRVTSAHGLEVRVPFLCPKILSLIKYINPLAGKGKLRQLPFNLPESVLNRPKQALSDAVSSKHVCWFKELGAYIYKTYGMFEKEAYMNLYKKFGYTVKPHDIKYWMPKWTTVDDPSAVMLSSYIPDNVDDINDIDI
jgi:asparagine synthase (glutamine-hydrolysing)